MSFQGAGMESLGQVKTGLSRGLDACVSVLFTVLGSYRSVVLSQPRRRLQLR